MRQYSRRERVLFAVLGLLVFAPTTLLGGYLYLIDRDLNVLWGFLGGFGGTIVCVMIAVRGRATRFLERDVLDPERKQ